MRRHFLLLLLPGAALCLPMQMTINQRQKECLYEVLDEGESITMSLFILSGPELTATVELDGPVVAAVNVASGAQLMEHASDFDSGGVRGNIVQFREAVNFEHLNIVSGFDEDEENDDAGADVNPDGRAADTAEQRRERRARQRKKALETRHRREQQNLNQRKHIRQEGEPYQKTIKAGKDGWYRYCVTGAANPIVAELDLRRETEMGGIDPDSGHVLTLEQKLLEQEEQDLAAGTASEEGIKDEDFAGTRDKLKTLRRLLADIQNKQQHERHRLILHSATNEHSYRRMVLGSLTETILFMAVTGFQVYTIRKWFKGAPVLGR